MISNNDLESKRGEKELKDFCHEYFTKSSRKMVLTGIYRRDINIYTHTHYCTCLKGSELVLNGIEMKSTWFFPLLLFIYMINDDV